MSVYLDSARQTTFDATDPDPISLADLPAGERGVVVRLAGGHELLGRMATLGLTPETVIAVLQNPGRGPLIVLVRGTRIALGRGEAHKIHVRRGEK